jgi:two-component sensor histidine kinase
MNCSPTPSNRRFAAAVEDDGVGIPADRSGESGGNSLGLRIVAGLTHQLDGELAQEPCSGTSMVLRFPAGKVFG